MLRKIAFVACVLALATIYAVALVGPLVAAGASSCCTGSLCNLSHRHRTPAKPDCHGSGHGLSDCSMQSCNPPEHKAVGFQPFLLSAPVVVVWEGPVAFLTPRAEHFLSTPARDVASPPPRPVFA